MNSQLKVKRAYDKLVREVEQYIRLYGGFDLDLYRLAPESFNDFNNLVMMVELTRDIIEYIRLNYTRNWNHYGYYFWQHAEVMEKQLEILVPIAINMIEDEKLDIDEILSQIKTPKILPDGIDYKKHNDIFEKLRLPSIMFHYIFVCENIMRKFIIQVLNENGYPSIISIGNLKLIKAIQDKKNKEATQNYLPIRGDHDIYYLDLIKLNRIFINLWNDCFQDKFERQSWICERIESLYVIRNRVAHSSGYLTNDELKSVEIRCREIIKQIDQYIK